MLRALASRTPKEKMQSAGYQIPGAFVFVLLLCLPVASLLWIAFSGSFDGFLLIATNVMPSAGLTTLSLMFGVGLFTAIVGTGTAWLVTYFEFPLKRVFQWALMLPLAIPTYISAYAFVEFFSYTGALQEIVRTVGGFTSRRDYWFPEIRSLWGTVFVLGLVLYPYVYLSVRALLYLQGSNIPDSARVLGATGVKLLWRITIPLARPAIVLGVTLAMMETINDIGAVEYMGTKTLTFSVFSVWLNQNDLAGAAQIAIFLLIIVGLLIFMEYASRGERRFHDLRSGGKKLRPPLQLNGVKAAAATVAVALPVLGGFGVPIMVLAGFALKDIGNLFEPPMLEALGTTLALGLIAATITVAIGMVLSFMLREHPTRMSHIGVRLASIGYAVPGTLIALGIFIPLAAFDNGLDAFLREYAGFSSGLLLTGSGTALVIAYVVRFMAMAEGNLENGLSKISPNLDQAARNLGRSRNQVLSQILIPLLRPAIITAALLVFVDVVKELSATILLRPFGMNTLSTRVYDFASQGRVEDGALACLIIILAGIIPVIMLVREQK